MDILLMSTVMISSAATQAYTMRNISLPGFFGDTTCDVWKQPQHVLFQLANTCFCVSYLAPNGRYGILFLHALLILGFLLNSTWAWNVICAPDMFSWSFSFMILNMVQTMFLLYTMRQVKFPRELEDIYVLMFQPLQVPRLLFKKLVSLEYAQICNLHAGEAYAMQNLTKTDRLGLLIAGKVSVLTDHHFLHYIHPREFLDSPEFESTRSGVDDKFKIVTEKGSHLDIRLPSVTGSMTYRGQLSSSSQANSITCSLNAYKYNEVYTSQQTLVRETKKRLRRSRKWKASSE
ncbi:popeye domain-containing protein 3 isoform X3 [Rhipicephalus sanguineus]|uniref:popeye domain-containing protein 3 isoform X3 n=1 Tax=Rhipicephalus sanguineus TaxID=34632 RepID=UPI00189414E4|nr:popeye domain-containing protein 3 isoform X3 [Rhipicephalus sanguineus]